MSTASGRRSALAIAVTVLAAFLLAQPACANAVPRFEPAPSGGPAPTGTWAVPTDWIPQRLAVLGPIRWIEYVSRKRFEGPRTFIFNHKHRLRNLPLIAHGVNRYGERAFAVLGGGYTITAHGIEDDPRDTRELPTGDSMVPRLLPRRLVGMGRMYALGYGRDSTLDLSGAGLVLAYVREPQAQLYIVPGSLERRR